MYERFDSNSSAAQVYKDNQETKATFLKSIQAGMPPTPQPVIANINQLNSGGDDSAPMTDQRSMEINSS
jgi:hypothetical protein